MRSFQQVARAARGAEYKPISAYGVIGNLRAAALVGVDGSIDWCCLPDLSSPSQLAALLDARRGGHFSVRPARGKPVDQRYLDGTNVLETVFEAPEGRLRVTDFLRLGQDFDAPDGAPAPPEIHRVIACEGGSAEVDIEWAPRFDHARAATRMERRPGALIARGGGEALTLVGLGSEEARVEDEGDGPIARARLRLGGGDRRALVMRLGDVEPAWSLDRALRLLEETAAAWRAWLHKEPDGIDRAWARPWAAYLTRSELVLKLLTHARTGAIAAAATTSLPEAIGSCRNWDYRFAWIRDASLTAQALIAVGHKAEATAFLHWVEDASERSGVRIMYDLHGGALLEEEELPHLEGYRGSRPVRIGNEAATQRQLDVYGEILSAAHESARRGEELRPSLRRFLASLADAACEAWREPDAGIWEVRGAPRHFVYSKAMVWVALDRALLLARAGVIEGDTARWQAEQERVRAAVLGHGFDPSVGAFTQAFRSRALDAANLLLPLRGLIPFDDPRVRSTIDRTLEELTEEGLVYRYRNDDGLPGREGAFGLTTFWLVDALAMSGRIDEAGELFEGMLGRANHLGLYSEQIDPRTGEMLGNYPQAFTHIGLINSSLYLAHARGIQVPAPPLTGTPGYHALERMGR